MRNIEVIKYRKCNSIETRKEKREENYFSLLYESKRTLEGCVTVCVPACLPACVYV